jgi:DNA-binding response OmpR family regulator
MRKKILVVEDDLELLELLRLSLKHAGLAVATATNGIEALKKARSVTPDLIVLDLVLPELDGFAVCETLRKHCATSAIPIILLTGLTSEFARYAGLEAGANECVTKPVSPKALVSRIRHCLRQAPAAAPRPPAAGRLRLARGVAGIYWWSDGAAERTENVRGKKKIFGAADFFLEKRQRVGVDKQQQGALGDASWTERGFFGKRRQDNGDGPSRDRDFTLPMHVIRNYVLEP